MPLGDSITDGWINVPGGYRTLLWQKLVQRDHKNIDFVGSRRSGPPNLPDQDNEGHSGWRIDQLRGQIDGWIGAYQPEVVLLHVGTNDILQHDQLSEAPARLEDLVIRICQDRPGVQVAVASLIPRPGLDDEVDAFNARVPAVVAGARAVGCDASFVDMHAALSDSDLDESATHPTKAGYDKMARVWYLWVSARYTERETAAAH